MSGEDNVLRTKILKEINEDFHQGDKLNSAFNSSDLLFELVTHLGRPFPAELSCEPKPNGAPSGIPTVAL